MTTRASAIESQPIAVWHPETGHYRLPDPPDREPDEVTNFDYVHHPGNTHHLAMHFGNPQTTLIAAERWIVPDPGSNKTRARRPDLLIAFNVNPARYTLNNGYIISEQGKPPDFVLEVASPSTAATDTGDKRREYAALGIPEYWRFDSTGNDYPAKLAGDRLAAGRYLPISIAEVRPGVLQGYSPALNLYLRWQDGQLHWHDPATGLHILRYEDQRSRADQAEARADQERQARLAAEERLRRIETEYRRLRGE